MPHDIEMKNMYGYMKLTLFGLVSRKELDLVLVELYFEFIENGLYKILIDIVHGEISVGNFELYFLIEKFRSQYHLDVTISILARSDQMRTTYLIESAANVKCINLRVYQDQQSTHNWLLNR